MEHSSPGPGQWRGACPGAGSPESQGTPSQSPARRSRTGAGIWWPRRWRSGGSQERTPWQWNCGRPQEGRWGFASTVPTPCCNIKLLYFCLQALHQDPQPKQKNIPGFLLSFTCNHSHGPSMLPLFYWSKLWSSCQVVLVALNTGAPLLTSQLSVISLQTVPQAHSPSAKSHSFACLSLPSLGR